MGCMSPNEPCTAASSNPSTNSKAICLKSRAQLRLSPTRSPPTLSLLSGVVLLLCSNTQHSAAKHSLGPKDCGLDRWQLFAESERNFGIGHLPIVVQHKQDPIISRQVTQLIPHLALLFATQYPRKRRKGDRKST